VHVVVVVVVVVVMSYHHYHCEDNGGGYYSVSRFLTESEPVQFDTNEDTRIHDLASEFDPSFPGDDVPADATITVPFWMCKAFTYRGFGVPKAHVRGILAENTRVWSKLNAEPKLVNVSGDYSDVFFEFASSYGKLLKEVAEVDDDDDSDDDEVTEEMYEAGKQMVEKASEAFKSRFKKMIVESLYDGGGKARNPPSFEESHLTRLERQLFRVGRESCEDFTRWKYQTNERMETCAMVTQARKRTQLKRKTEEASGRDGGNGGPLRPRNF
tara:strand:- start:2669 stop:3478 length:810 start_codon:yes stop_codon:yes gene_type:complete